MPYRGAGMVLCWERSPPTSVAWFSSSQCLESGWPCRKQEFFNIFLPPRDSMYSGFDLNILIMFIFQTSHSAFISMLTVALQLCGISIEFTHKVNFIFTALLAALKDFGVFLFGVIVAHCIVDYLVTTGLLMHVLKTIPSSWLNISSVWPSFCCPPGISI